MERDKRGLQNEEIESRSDATASASTLRELNLGSNGIGVRGAAALARLIDPSRRQVGLSSLDLDHNRFGSAGVRALLAPLLASPGGGALERLGLTGVQADDDGARVVAKVIVLSERLQDVSLQFNERITEAGADAIARAVTVSPSMRKVWLLAHPWGPPRAAVEGVERALEARRSVGHWEALAFCGMSDASELPRRRRARGRGRETPLAKFFSQCGDRAVLVRLVEMLV